MTEGAQVDYGGHANNMSYVATEVMDFDRVIGKALEFADYNIKVMEDSVRTNVYRAYYSVLIAQKRRALLETTVQRLETLLHDQTEMYKNGFAEKLDLDKTQVSLNNLRTSMNQALNLVIIGNAALKFSTGLV